MTATQVKEVLMIILGIYIRISDDDKDENGEFTREGVKRQETDCRKLSAELSRLLAVPIELRVYDDNNITAADERVRRPAFEQLLLDLEASTVQGFLFYHADRVARLELDAARVTRLFRLNPKLIGRSVQGGTDLSTDEGRAMFVVQAVMGGMEVSATRRRVTRRNQAAAASGKNHGGKRPFGWEDNRRTLRKQEADLIADAVRCIPKGKSVSAIRKEWIAAGVKPTAEGKGPIFRHTVLSRITNPRICGYRVYLPAAERREITNLWMPDHILYIDGEPVKGDWEPIVTPAEFWACIDVLEESRTRRHDHDFSRNHAKYLLSGIARCGECGAKIYGKAGKDDAPYRYQCVKELGGCGGIKRVGPPLDTHVIALFLEATRRNLGTVVHTPINDTVHASRLAALQQEIKDVMARRKPDHPKRISTSVAMDMIAELEQETADLRRKTRALTAAKAAQEAVPSLLEEWESCGIDMQRARLRREISAVVINRTGRGRRFDPGCIEVVWAA